MTISALKKLVKQHDKRLRFLTGLGKPQRILELGCGSGFNCKFLKSLYPDAEIHGVDLLEPDCIPDFVIYEQLDLDSCCLPYPDGQFDALLLIHVLEHLRFPMRLGPEINRVMKVGGRMYVEAPNWTTLLVPSFGLWREQGGPFNFFDDATHLRPWSKHGLFHFLDSGCSLSIRELGTMRNWLRAAQDIIRIPYGLVKRDRRLIMQAFWNLYGWSIYGVGQKE